MEFIDLDKKLSGSDSSYEKLPSDKKTKRNIISEILHFILAVAFVFAGAFLIVTFIAQRTQVNGSSMETTLSDKDNLIVEKISYHFIKPHRFDIVVFPHEVNGKNIYYIKRVIGLPGEKVQISNGVIYINDVALDEDYGCEVMSEAKLAASPIVLGDDEYFVLGDNRNHSSDSREIGPVKEDTIVGRAVFRIWPLSKFGRLK